MKSNIAAFILSTILAYFITPYVEKFAFKLGAIDYPDERKVHQEPVPRLGGLAIVVTLSVSVLFYLIWRYVQHSLTIISLIKNNPTLVGVFAGSILIFIVGSLDDIYDASPEFKFLGQLTAALFTIFLPAIITGSLDNLLIINYVANPLGGGLINIPVWLGISITLFWIVALTNIINFIDGLDGLAAGVVAITAVSLFIVASQTGRSDLALLMAALTGTLLGFLRFNFHPAKIFMGDSGSMFLGFLIGGLTIEGASKSAATLALLVPLVIIGVPLFDAAFAIWRRFVNRKPLTQADKEHIHHRLMKRGLSHKKTVLLIYGWSIVLSSIGLSLRFIGGSFRLIILIALVPLSFFLAVYSGLFDWLLGSNKSES